jgi:hypothetical protein
MFRYYIEVSNCYVLLSYSQSQWLIIGILQRTQILTFFVLFTLSNSRFQEYPLRVFIILFEKLFNMGFFAAIFATSSLAAAIGNNYKGNSSRSGSSQGIFRMDYHINGDAVTIRIPNGQYGLYYQDFEHIWSGGNTNYWTSASAELGDDLRSWNKVLI